MSAKRLPVCDCVAASHSCKRVRRVADEVNGTSGMVRDRLDNLHGEDGCVVHSVLQCARRLRRKQNAQEQHAVKNTNNSPKMKRSVFGLVFVVVTTIADELPTINGACGVGGASVFVRGGGG